jgi:NUMOD3 motif
MFIENKYYRYYNNIIERAKSRVLVEYTESHHIIPKSLGGSNSKDNLVKLTGKEHFICHLLLTKITEGDARKKMVYGAWRMAVKGRDDQQRYKMKSRSYEHIRKERSAVLKAKRGKDHPLFGRKTGRTIDTFTTEWKENISKAKKGGEPWNKGIPRTQEVKDSVSKANKGKTPWNKNKKSSDETKRKMSEGNTGKKWIRDNVGTRHYASPKLFEQILSAGGVPGFGPRKK